MVQFLGKLHGTVEFRAQISYFNTSVNLICYCIFPSPVHFHPFPCVSACLPFCLCLGWINYASHSVQQNSLRGQRLKLSSLGGSSTHATLDRTGSPVRLESELSSPQEVAEDLSNVKSKGRELEEENTQRSGGEDEENDQRDEKDQERSKGSVEIEKEKDIATANVKEECCGGDDEEKFKGGEESENTLERNKSDRNSFKIERECFAEKQNEETSGNKESGHGRSREDKEEQTDSEEEMVEIDAVIDCSNSNEDVERCSVSKAELKQCDEEGPARYLKSVGGETEGNGSDIDEESAALKPQTAQEGESLLESGSDRVHPAEVDEKSDRKMVEQKRESLTGSLDAEVWFSAVSLCAHVPQLLALQPLPNLLLLLLTPACSSLSSALEAVPVWTSLSTL